MSAVLFFLRVEARARWRAWLAMALLFGLLGGGVIAALAGARRTETAYPRFRRATRAFDVLVTNGGTTPTNLNKQFDFDEVARLPQVIDSARVGYYLPIGSGPNGRAIVDSDLAPFVALDGKFGATLNRHRVLQGRLPRRENELALSFLAADRVHLHVGDVVRLQLGEAGTLGADIGAAELEPFRVVGIVATQGGFPPLTGGLPPLAVVAPAYGRSHPDASQVLAVRLRRGAADVPGFTRELTRLAHGDQIVTSDASEQTTVVERGLDVEATALRLLGIAVGLVGVLLLGQALVRQATFGADDHPILRTLGLTPSQLWAFGALRAAAMALVASTVAVITGIALSPLTPVGVARNAELHRGVEVNLAHLAIGAAVVLVTVVVLGTLAAGRAVGRASTSASIDVAGRPSRVATAAGRAGLSAPATVGVGMALEPGRGRSAVPVRSAVAGAALGVAVLVAVVTFASSLGHLFDDQRLYGWNWDVQYGDSFAPDLSRPAAALTHRAEVTDVALATIDRLRVGAVRVDALAIEGDSDIGPTVVSGRAPHGPDEILLGGRTLRSLGRRVGEQVAVRAGGHVTTMRIVGRGVLTEFAGAARLGEGAVVTFEGLRRLAPDRTTDVALVRLRPGTDGAAFAGRHPITGANVYLPAKPSDLGDLERVGGLPSIVAALLGLTAVGTLTHVLITSVRRRRRDLAVLKVLGFARRQVSGAMAWQATVLAGLAAVAGLPIGVVAGRWGWRLFADQLGVPARPVTPLLAAVVLLPATLVLGNVVAAVPAWLASRTRPAVVLRTD
ncbi:MAG: putative transport system permease protein [Actinomycetota bacterium]|jgi:ABC-type lipoprotein release transport system permease subunit